MAHGFLSDTWREKLPPTCPGCGYNLTGLTSPVCPECGQAVYWSDVRDNARRLYYAAQRIDDMNDLCSLAPYLAAAGALIVLFFWTIDFGVGLARVSATLLALGAIGSSVQVFRVGTVPEHAREVLPHRPQYMKGAASALFGAGVILLAFFLP